MSLKEVKRPTLDDRGFKSLEQIESSNIQSLTISTLVRTPVYLNCFSFRESELT